MATLLVGNRAKKRGLKTYSTEIGLFHNIEEEATIL